MQLVNPTGKRPLRRPRRSWEENIRIDRKEMDVNIRNFLDSAQDRDYWKVIVIATLKLRVP